MHRPGVAPLDARVEHGDADVGPAPGDPPREIDRRALLPAQLVRRRRTSAGSRTARALVVVAVELGRQARRLVGRAVAPVRAVERAARDRGRLRARTGDRAPPRAVRPSAPRFPASAPAPLELRERCPRYAPGGPGGTRTTTRVTTLAVRDPARTRRTRPRQGSDGSVPASAVARSAASTGAPNRIRRPPNATDTSASQARPSAAPPMTSVSQWTPSITLDPPTIAARPIAAASHARWTVRLRPRPSTIAHAPKQAKAAAVCPLGNDGPLNPASGWMSGRARSTTTLTTFAITFWPTTTVARKPATDHGARRRTRTNAEDRHRDHHDPDRRSEERHRLEHVRREGRRVGVRPGGHTPVHPHDRVGGPDREREQGQERPAHEHDPRRERERESGRDTRVDAGAEERLRGRGLHQLPGHGLRAPPGRAGSTAGQRPSSRPHERAPTARSRLPTSTPRTIGAFRPFPHPSSGRRSGRCPDVFVPRAGYGKPHVGRRGTWTAGATGRREPAGPPVRRRGAAPGHPGRVLLAWWLVAYAGLVGATVGLGLLVTRTVGRRRAPPLGSRHREPVVRRADAPRRGRRSRPWAATSPRPPPSSGSGCLVVVGLLWWRRRDLVAIGVLVVRAHPGGHRVRDHDRARRPRPPAVPRLDAAPPTSSFPSGHTAAAVVLAGGLAWIVLRRWGRHRWTFVDRRRVGARAARGRAVPALPRDASSDRRVRRRVPRRRVPHDRGRRRHGGRRPHGTRDDPGRPRHDLGRGGRPRGQDARRRARGAAPRAAARTASTIRSGTRCRRARRRPSGPGRRSRTAPTSSSCGAATAWCSAASTPSRRPRRRRGDRPGRHRQPARHQPRHPDRHRRGGGHRPARSTAAARRRARSTASASRSWPAPASTPG